MAYKMPTQKYSGESGSYNRFRFETRWRIGSALYSFDGDIGHKPAIGMEIWDIFLIPGLKVY